MVSEPKPADTRIRPNPDYRLDKITVGELVGAFFAYPTIQVYIALVATCTALTLYGAESPWPIAATVAVSGVTYSFAEYLIHRGLA